MSRQSASDRSLNVVLSALAMRRIGSRSLLRRIRVFRVSSEQPSIFVANLVAGLAAADQDDPDVIAAKKVGGLLVERTKEGRSARRWCGTVEVRLDMLAGGEHSRQLIGYVTLIGATLFVYLLSSAAAANLRDASAAEDCGNGAVETIREAIRVLTTIQREHEPGFRLELHYTDETRAARSRPQATKLLTTATRYQVRLFLRGQEWNPSRTTDAQVIDMLLGMAAVERDLSVQRMLRGKVSLLIIHRLPEPLRSNVPFTHEAYRYRRTDEHGRAVAEVDEHRPAPKENAGAILKSLVRAVLTAGREAEAAGRKTVDWNELACTLAKAHDLRERSPEAVASGAPGLISELRGDGPGLALRRLLGRRYRQAWRAGRLPWTTELAADIGDLAHQAGTVTYDEHRVPTLHAWVECPIPAGLNITDAEWDELDALLAPRSTNAGKPATDWATPLGLVAPRPSDRRRGTKQ